jgi:hypothetical protein
VEVDHGYGVLETVLGLWLLHRMRSPWRVRAVLHCCRGEMFTYQVRSVDGVECGIRDGSGIREESGMFAAIECRLEPVTGCKKQTKYMNVTERGT